MITPPLMPRPSFDFRLQTKSPFLRVKKQKEQRRMRQPPLSRVTLANTTEFTMRISSLFLERWA